MDDDDAAAAAAPAKLEPGRRLGTLQAASTRARPVGGLLSTSEYAKKTESKTKFKPNMKRRTKVIEDDDDDDE
ncbi:hypothetical protein RQP46_003555 [Phenoliferia psychrophenolica]